MVKISACVIVKNEQDNIQGWLKCMQQIADEIIVVDTGSTDNTKSIVNQSPARLYDFKWCDDFAAAKNHAISKAMGDWILFLDADEYFLPECYNSVKKVLNNCVDNIDALACKWINIDENNKFINCFLQIRIFRNNGNLCYQDRIHEKVVRKDNKKLQISELPANICIYHTGYKNNLMQEKARRNIELLEKKIMAEGEKPKDWFYLADCYFAMKNYEKAIFYISKFNQHNMILPGAMVYTQMLLINSLFLTKAQPDKILTAIEFAAKQMPTIPDFKFLQAGIFMAQGKYNSAHRAIGQGVILWEHNNDPTSNMENLKCSVYNMEAEIAVKMGIMAKALVYYTMVLQLNRYDEAVFAKYCLLLQNINSHKIIKLVNKVYDCKLEQDKCFLQKMSRKYLSQSLANYYNKTTPVENYGQDSAAIKQEIVNIYKEIMMVAINSNNIIIYKKAIAILPCSYKKILQNAHKKFSGDKII